MTLLLTSEQTEGRGLHAAGWRLIWVGCPASRLQASLEILPAGLRTWRELAWSSGPSSNLLCDLVQVTLPL